MADRDIAVIIPALDEQATIAKVICDFRTELPDARICVFDNDSTDNTYQIAKASGAEVFRVKKRGKGNVLRYALRKIDSDIYVLVDGDDTYPAYAVHRLVRDLDRYDMVIANRFAYNSQGFSGLHVIGNKLILSCLRFCFPVKMDDLLSGYRAFTKGIAAIRLASQGFTIETEQTIRSLEAGYDVKEIPIRYKKRPRGSITKLHSFKDAIRITSTIFYLFWKFRRPEFYYIASSSVLSIAAGLL